MTSINFVFTQVFAVLFVLIALAYAEERKAIVVLTGEKASGNVTFTQTDNGPVSIKGIVVNLTPGKHGFHIHAKGDITGGCITTASHFNPDNKQHGGPTAAERHVGDLGNIFAQENGIAEIDIKDSIISLTGKNNIIGRAVVVHSDEDDLGLREFSDSLTTGHAGTRVCCGVIGIQHPEGRWFTQNQNGASMASATPLLPLLLVIITFRLSGRILS